MKQTGFTCDRQACGKFMVGDVLPDGWLVLRPQITDPSVKQDTVTLEFCSNTCLAISAADRALGLDSVDVVPLIRKGRKEMGERGVGAALVRGGAPAGVDNGAFARHVRWHVNRQQPESTCSFCQEDTAPSNGAGPRIGDTLPGPASDTRQVPSG